MEGERGWGAWEEETVFVRVCVCGEEERDEEERWQKGVLTNLLMRHVWGDRVTSSSKNSRLAKRHAALQD